MKLPAAAAAGLALALAGAVLAAAAVGSTTAAQTVKVTEREYALSFTPRSVAPGTVTFTVRNAGKVAHALAVSGPGLKMKRTATIAPGNTASLTVKLGKGTFTMWCPVGRHAAAGMKKTFSVGAAPKVGTPTTTNETPPTTTGGGGYGYGY
jgi:plastocyanin